ncbi:MAG: hypothetical protein HN733_01420 [Gammaproteobacteria bacterium]|jgi:hypothetical protein|nr:hypothetical protein [Gammaproteobacteria bacterium]
MSKIKETRKAGTKTLIAIAIIGVSVYIGFEPLFDKVGGGVPAQVLGASFGAIFMIVLTMYLLNKQTEIEQESKKSEKVFEEKVKLYKSMLATTKEMLRDGKVSSEETTELSFSMIELQMVGADETINAFSSVLDKINKIFNQQVGDPVDLEDVERVDILRLLSVFAQKCRVDLGINESELKEEIFEKTFSEIEEAIKGKKDTTKYNFKENKNLGKGRLVLAVVKDYVENNPEISFEELLLVFPSELRSVYGVFARTEEVEEKHQVRYFMKDADRIALSDSTIAVCNQWGITNIDPFLEVCKKLGLEIN